MKRCGTYTEVEVYVLFVCLKLGKNFLVNEKNYLPKMRTRAKKNVASNCVRRRMHRGTFILIGCFAQKAIGTADAKEKQELWNTIQDKALEECWEYPLTYTNFVMVSQKNVTGLDGSSVVPEFIDYLSIHVD